MINTMLLANDIKNIDSSENAVAVSRKILSQSNLDSTLELSSVSYLTGKGRKTLSRRINGWLVAFKLPVPEGFSPDRLWVELYPELGEFYIPDLL